jgi:hypothetical protein
MPSSATNFLDTRVDARVSRVPGTAIVAKTLVKVNASDHGKADAAGANVLCLGVANTAGATTDKDIDIITRGLVPCVAGGTVALGDEIVSDASGQGVARGTTATVLYKVIGYARTPAASGELFMLDICPFSVWGANAS